MKAPRLGPSALVAVLLLLSSSPWPWALAQVSFDTSIEHEITVHEYGFITVTEKVSFRNDGSAPSPMEGFEIRYPRSLAPSVSTHFVSPRGESLLQQDGNLTKLTVIPPTGEVLQPGSDTTFTVTLVLADALRDYAPNQYALTIPIVGTELPVSTIATAITLPEKTTLVGQLPGFSMTQEGERQIWRGNVSIDRLLPEIIFRAETASAFTILAFPKATREIIIHPLGEVSVRDHLEVLNLGNRSLTSLKLKPLIGNLSSITLVPTTEPPPLANPKTLNLLNDTLDLVSAFSRPINQGEKRVINIEYPYPRGLLKTDDRSLLLNLSIAAPVEGVVENYEIRVNHPPSFAASPIGGGLGRRNATHLEDGLVEVIIRPKTVWAVEEAMPVATGIFAATFSIMLLSRRITGTEASQRLRRGTELRRSVEEKVVETRRLLLDLSKSGRGEASRRTLDELRVRTEELKSRASRGQGEIGAELTREGGNLQRIYQDILEADREWDREVRGLLTAYRSYHTGGGRPESLKASIDEYTRRVNRAEERLAGQLERLTKELS